MTGILAVMIGLGILVWSIAFVQRKSGGVVLIVLSIALLLFGGGLFLHLIGIAGGIAGLKINKPLGDKQPGSILQRMARL